MPKTAIPLGDTPFASPYNVVGKEACNNFYLERAITPNSKVPYYYVSVPGLRIFTSRSSTNVCRGIFRTSNNRLFAQFGNQFTEILSNGTKLVRGTIGTYSGVVSMADNSQQLILVDGEYGYILNFATNVFTKIDEETFQNGATHVTCIDTYFLVNRPNSMQYNWSTPNNGLMWDALDFATKQGIPDDIVALKECHNQLWVFGTYSTEVHYNTGDIETQVWQRYESAIIDIGCSAPHSLARAENKIFWLGTDKTGNVAVWSNDSLTPIKISNRGIEERISRTQSQLAIGYTYAQAGHVFYCISLPGGNETTLVYDVTTQTWHERSSMDENTDLAKRWRAVFSTYAFGKNIFGDVLSDALYYTDMDYYKNDLPEGGTINITRSKDTPILQSNQNRVRHNSLQILFEQGTGTVVLDEDGNGQNPQVILKIFNEDSEAETQRMTSIGRLGEYGIRSRFLCLGHSRNRRYRIVVTEPIKVVLVGIIADMTELSQ